MKIKRKILTVCVAFAFGFFCAADNFAQDEKKPDDLKTPIVGGYAPAEATAPEVVKAAKFAVKTQAKKDRAKIKLMKISRAEQQVVAGMNYNVCLLVETKEKGKKSYVPQTVQTVVYVNPQGKYELISWAIAACADETPPVPAK